MERKPPKLDFGRIEGMTGKEVLENLTDDEREYFIERIRKIMPPEEFDSLTEINLNKEIIFYILMEETCSHLELFHCIMSKENADFIHRQAEYYGINDGQALEHLISVQSVDDPELAAVLSVMHINHTIKKQSEKQQIRAMFIIAGTLIGEIIKTNKYTLNEAADETVKNLNEAGRIVDDLKKKNED